MHLQYKGNTMFKTINMHMVTADSRHTESGDIFHFEHSQGTFGAKVQCKAQLQHGNMHIECATCWEKVTFVKSVWWKWQFKARQCFNVYELNCKWKNWNLQLHVDTLILRRSNVHVQYKAKKCSKRLNCMQWPLRKSMQARSVWWHSDAKQGSANAMMYWRLAPKAIAFEIQMTPPQQS